MANCFQFSLLIVLGFDSLWRLCEGLSSKAPFSSLNTLSNSWSTRGPHVDPNFPPKKNPERVHNSSSWDPLRPYESEFLSGSRVTDCSSFISAEAFAVMSSTQQALDSTSTHSSIKRGADSVENDERPVIFNRTQPDVENKQSSEFTIPTRFLYRCLQSLDAEYIPFESPFGLQEEPVLTLSIALNEVVELEFDGTLGLKLTFEYWWREPRLQWYVSL